LGKYTFHRTYFLLNLSDKSLSNFSRLGSELGLAQHLLLAGNDTVAKYALCTVCRLVMAALRSRCGHYILVLFLLLWSPYVIGQTIYIFMLFLLLLSFFISSPNLSGRRLDVYHTSTHGVAFVRI